MYKIRALQLYAVCKADNLKHGRSYLIFRDLYENLNMLSKNGLVLKINGVEKIFRGYLAFCLGDTPALNWLGGFKETVGITKKYCRCCEASYEKVEGEYRKELFCSITPRKLDKHLSILNKMKAKSTEDNVLVSKQTGINYSSILLNIKDFDICQCLLQDPMHILYEGICHLELSCLFNNLIVVNKYFTEVWLNKQIKNFKYYTVDIHDKPNGIDRKYYVRTENMSRDGYSSYQKFS